MPSYGGIPGENWISRIFCAKDAETAIRPLIPTRKPSDGDNGHGSPRRDVGYFATAVGYFDTNEAETGNLCLVPLDSLAAIGSIERRGLLAALRVSLV